MKKLKLILKILPEKKTKYNSLLLEKSDKFLINNNIDITKNNIFKRNYKLKEIFYSSNFFWTYQRLYFINWSNKNYLNNLKENYIYNIKRDLVWLVKDEAFRKWLINKLFVYRILFLMDNIFNI